MNESSGVLATRSADPSLYEFSKNGTILLGSQSVGSGELIWPRRLRSPIDGGEVVDVVLANTGVIWSWTFVHRPWPGAIPPDPATPDGYAVGLVDLDEDGPRVVGTLVGPSDRWEVGARVRAVPLPFRTDDAGTEAVLGFEAEVTVK